MDLYHIWCNLKPDVEDVGFAEKLSGYLGHLHDQGLIESWRVTRRKLGLGPQQLGDFHIIIELRDLHQLENAFARVAGRRDPVESLHAAVNSLVTDAVFALYRDFPDSVRHRGEEKF